jgi:hypothetical protein
VGAAAFAVALTISVGWIVEPARAGEAPAKQLKLSVVPFQAKFQLDVDDGKNVDKSSGFVFLRPDATLCVAVEKPLHQFLAFSSRELNIYYPDDHVILRAKGKAGQLPPMIDALLLGYVDPSAILPPTSKVLEQTRDDVAHTLTTRWSIVGPDGKSHGQLRSVESKDGTDSMELMADDGELMGRYNFSNRVPVGRAKLPSLIKVLQRRASHDRTDTWTLDALAPEPDQDPAGVACTTFPKDIPVKDLAL